VIVGPDLAASIRVPQRRIVIAAIVTVSALYLPMFAIVYDYSRWVSSWAVCLILHAVKALPASQAAPPISGNDRKTTLLGWIVTASRASASSGRFFQIFERRIRT
jgi:hypothetical protein